MQSLRNPEGVSPERVSPGPVAESAQKPSLTGDLAILCVAPPQVGIPSCPILKSAQSRFESESRRFRRRGGRGLSAINRCSLPACCVRLRRGDLGAGRSGRRRGGAGCRPADDSTVPAMFVCATATSRSCNRALCIRAAPSSISPPRQRRRVLTGTARHSSFGLSRWVSWHALICLRRFH